MDGDDLSSNTAGGAARRPAPKTHTAAAKHAIRPPARPPAQQQKPASVPQPPSAPAPAALAASGARLGPIIGGLRLWRDALLAWVSALGAYEREVGESGGRAIGPRWGAARAAVAGVASSLTPGPGPATLPDPDGAQADETLLAALMAAGDVYEAATYRLDAAAGDYLDPNVQAAVVTGMSRTFSENLKGLARAVREAAVGAKARQREALSAATQAGAAFVSTLAVDTIVRVFGGAETRGGVATELYMSVLLCLKSARAAGLLEAAKGTSLGCPSDAPELAQADTLALAGYHPLQAMCYAPSAPSEPSPQDQGQEAGGLLNLTLPQARLAVVYDLAPLLDRRRAQEFGPLASMASGLNYKVVERLRTIRASPVHPSELRGSSLAGPLAEGPVLVTTDGGATARKLGPARYPSSPGAREAPWAPLAGAQLRVEAYNAATSALILERLRADRADGWTLDLRARYEAAVDDGSMPSGECGAEALVNALAEEFEKAYERDPPQTPRDFHALVVPEAPNPSDLQDYITAAVARIGNGLLEERLRRMLMTPSRRFPYAAVEREARLSQAIHSLDAARALGLRIKKAFRPDPEVFDLPPSQRKSALLRVFRRVAAAALADAPVHCAPPSLKLFAVTGVRPADRF